MERKYVRIYNLKIDELIEEENLYSEIIFTYDLHYYLENMEGVYKCVLGDNFFDKILKRKRKMFFAIERNWIEKQNIYVKESTIEIGPEGYTCETSTVTICVQLYKEELTALKNELISSEDIIKEILQKTLEFIVFKYNELMNGKHFFTPTYLDCSMICYMVCKNYLEKKEILWQKVTPNDLIVNSDENNNINKNISKNIKTWKYFLNKTKHHFYSLEYLDVIISGAVCIESYIYDILRINLESVEEIEEFSTEKNDKGDRYSLSVRKLIRKIRDKGWIQYSLSNAQMDTILAKILEPRNNIMHGKYEFSFNLRENATKSYDALMKFFDTVSVEENKINLQDEDEYIYCINTNKFVRYKQEIEKAIKESDIEKKNALIKKAINNYPDSQLGYRIIAINLAKQYIKINSEEMKIEFEKYINMSIEKSKNKNQSLLFKAYGYFIMQDYNKCFEVLNEIDRADIDERCICLYIQNSLCFCKESLNNIKNKLNIKRTYCLSRYHNPTYDLLYIVAGDMFFEFKEYKKAKAFYEKVYERNTLNKFLLLKILRCYKELNDYSNLLKLILDILENEFYIFDECYQIDFEEFYVTRLDFYKEIKDIIHSKFCYIPIDSNLIYNIEKNNKVFLIPQSIEYLEMVHNRKIKTNKANEIFKNSNMNAEVHIGTSGLENCMVEMKMGQLININNIKDELLYRGNLHC